MHPYPHLYGVTASATSTGLVDIDSPSLPTLKSAPPPEFDGPGGAWSPETLLCAALADCFVLTFRALTVGNRFAWSKLECRVEGTLDRVEKVAQFAKFTTFAHLTLPVGADEAKAHSLLEKSEQYCLISNSVKGTRSLVIQITTATS